MTRFVAVDTARGLGGQAVVAAGATLQFIDLASGDRRITLTLPAPVQGRMAVDEPRRRLYATTRNTFGNNTLAIIDLDSGALVFNVELKPTGCIDTGTRGGCAVIPSTGHVLVCTTVFSDTRFDGLVRVDGVSGQLLGAVQNTHLTNDPFNRPTDVAVFESRNLAVVANANTNGLTLVPLDQVNREIRGGDTPACQDFIPSGTLPQIPTDGTVVLGIAADPSEDRGAIILRGTTATTADGRCQVFSISGNGAGASLVALPSVALNRPVKSFGLAVDSQRNEVFIANGTLPARRVDLVTGGLLSDVPSIALSDNSFVAPVTGRNRLIQAGLNTVVGEYCLP